MAQPCRRFEMKMKNIWILLCLTFVYGATAEDYASNPSVRLFQEYLKINTTTYNNLSPAVEFWDNLAARYCLPINVYTYKTGMPVIVIKWAGSDPSLASIMLNSHVDVVPADEKGWTYPPFSGHLSENGEIYGRGTQDMKSVSIQYYEALSRLKTNNVSLLRNVYMTLMPDEEVGAEAGMIPFLESEEFVAMNVGFELDEGTAYPVPFIPVFYQDKVPWQIQVDCYGIATHGSSFPETNSTATGKCRNVMNSLLKFRDEQYEVSLKAGMNDFGVFTSVNLNKLSGGTANNVIPAHVSLTFDIRLATTLNEEQFEAQLNQWISEAGENVTLTYILKNAQSPATILNSSNPYWTTFSGVAKNLGVTIFPAIPTGSTDARFVRGAGFPALGFSPMPDTDFLLHADNERVNADTFLRGIDIYEQLIEKLANIPADQVSVNPSDYVVRTSN